MFNLKTLVLLSVVQAAALVFLGIRLMAVESQLSENAALRPIHSAAPNTAATQSFDNRDEFSGADLNDIRTAMQEEMVAVLDRLAAMEARMADRPAPAPERTVTPKEAADLSAAFESEFNRALSLRSVSPLQMAKLEESIARLPPAQRRTALSRLSKALSTGAIDARLYN